MGDDAADVDGYHDLLEEDQTRIARALEHGHIDDDDLSPHQDPEQNRPGMKQKRTPKKKAAEPVCAVVCHGSAEC